MPALEKWRLPSHGLDAVTREINRTVQMLRAAVMVALSSACRAQSASLSGRGSFPHLSLDTAQSELCIDI